jgi:hypothetical protein
MALRKLIESYFDFNNGVCGLLKNFEDTTTVQASLSSIDMISLSKYT